MPLTREFIIGFVTMLAAFLGSAPRAEEPSAKPEKPLSLAKWALSLQKDVGKTLPGRTMAEHEAIVEAFRKDFRTKHSTVFVEFNSKVTQVLWKDGIAAISTLNEIPDKQQAIIQIEKRRHSIEILMNQETATAIKPGTPLTVTARLHLTQSAIRYSRFDRKESRERVKWQPFYNVENTRLKCHLGGYCSGEYSVEIAGKSYPGAWSDPPDEEPMAASP